MEALYAYDYEDSEGSLRAASSTSSTGDLRDQYETDLSQGGIIDTYEQVSATTSYEVLDVGLQQVNDAQDTATLVVFGAVRGQVGEQRGPSRRPRVGVPGDPRGGAVLHADGPGRWSQVDGDWKISQLTLLTTS